MAKAPQLEHEWFRSELEAIFGAGAQSAFARFLAKAGAGRSHGTILRAISAYATGRNRLSAEMIALIQVLRAPQEAKAMIKEAIGETRQNY